MKNLLIISISLLLSTSSGLSQYGWEIQLGGINPQGYLYNDIYFTDENTGYLLSDILLKKTTDGGSNWSNIEFQAMPPSQKNRMFFINFNTGWIAGSRILKTTNSGLNWHIQDSTINPNSIHFGNELTGWVTANGGLIYNSTDGGSTWTQQTSGISDNINKVYFTSLSKGYCAAAWGKILTTSNGGINWIVNTDPGLSFFYDIEFINSNTGFVCGTGGTILKTTNSGLNWYHRPTGNSANFGSIKFISESTGFAFGTFGAIIKTTNYGDSWFDAAASNIHGTVQSVSKAGNNNFWLIADSAIVYRASAPFTSWSEVFRFSQTSENLNSVFFTDSETGWTCGNNGTFFRTVNGGYNWLTVNTGVNTNFNSVWFYDQNTGYLIGGKNVSGVNTGYVLRSTSGGINWQQVHSDTVIFYSMSFLNSSNGWIGGGRNKIIKTINGNDFTQIFSQVFNSSIITINFINESTGFYGGSGSILYRSTNGGFNWTMHVSGFGPRSIKFVNSFTGYALRGSSLFKTTNSGENWSAATTIGTGIEYNDLSFPTPNRGWVCGYMLQYTSNSGTTWQMQINPSQNEMRSIHFVNDNEGWAVGNYGTILHTYTAGIGITQISTEIPQTFALFQNYPNPFNPTTKIRFNIPHLRGVDAEGRRGVLLKIYDALGREIEILVNEELNPGTYEIDWNASNYPSGVYFYSLTAGTFTQTKKMVVLK
jgi:photosystem II stability/assembly factor-like uncharacterized protein